MSIARFVEFTAALQLLLLGIHWVSAIIPADPVSGHFWKIQLWQNFCPAPSGGTGYCFRAICFFLSLFLCQQHYKKMAGPICMKFSGTTWLNFGSIRVNGSAGQRSVWLLSKLLPVELDISFALAWWQHFLSMAADKSNKSLSFARWQQGSGKCGPALASTENRLVM